MNTLPEQLDCAQHSADFTRKHLCAALKTATALEALILMPLIEQANRVLDGIQSLQSARSCKE